MIISVVSSGSQYINEYGYQMNGYIYSKTGSYTEGKNECEVGLTVQTSGCICWAVVNYKCKLSSVLPCGYRTMTKLYHRKMANYGLIIGGNLYILNID